VPNLRVLLTQRHSKPEEKWLPLTFSLPMYEDRTFSNSYALPSAYNQAFSVARGTIIFIVQEAIPLVSCLNIPTSLLKGLLNGNNNYALI
jgi:hypothetical protein